jgi:cardiolipin synthase A/B
VSVPLLTALGVSWVAYLAVVSVWIVLQRRAPAATMAWILSLAALPGLGVAFYFVFGPRRIVRSSRRRLRARAQLGTALDRARAAAHPAPPEHALRLAKLGAAADGIPLSSCSRVDLLVDGARTYDALCAAIAAARHHVHLEYYIFVPDAVGERIMAALEERARAGVQVRLLVDAFGSALLRRRHRARLRAAGVEVARFHRLRFSTIKPLVNFRTHRKIVVVDGVVGFTGGINVSAVHDERLGPRAFRDTHLRLEGLAVRWLQIIFLEDWEYATGRSPTAGVYFPEVGERGARAVQIVASGPDSEQEAIKKMYFAAITGAAQRVLVRTPYLVPDEAMLTALTTAALRGVDVRILVPLASDSRLVTAAGRSYFEELLRAGVRVYEYLPRMLHAKTLVVDDGFAAVGTANFDNRSFRLNFEVSAVVHGPELAAELGQLFATDLEEAREVRLGDARRSGFGRRLGEAAARLLSPLL